MKNKKYVSLPFDEKKDEGFASSIDSFNAEEIVPMGKSSFKKKNISISDIVRYIFMFICGCVFIVCLVLILDNIIDKYKGNQIYDEASNLFNPVTIGSSDESKGDSPVMTPYERVEYLYGGAGGGSSSEEYNMDLTSVKASISSLKQVNPDVIGWIYAENTRINYPLMQSAKSDDDYYLNHAYTGEYLAVGSIYMSSYCDKVLKNNYNTLIYGHNVTNGTMFHDVTKFEDAQFFNNTKIYIYTLDGAYIYKPVSIYRTTYDYNYIQTSFTGEDEFLSFADRVLSNTVVPTDERINSGDTMITLSTCNNSVGTTTKRFALHAKLIAFVEG